MKKYDAKNVRAFVLADGRKIELKNFPVGDGDDQFHDRVCIHCGLPKSVHADAGGSNGLIGCRRFE